MVLEGIRKLLDRLSIRAVFNRLDRRKLQNELDVHKLFLLTSHHLKIQTGEQLGEHYVQKLTAQAADLGNQGMQTAVAAALRQQLIAISTSLHNCLLDAEDPMPAAQHAMLAKLRQQQHAAAAASPKAQRPRGLAAAMGAVDHRQQPTALRRDPATAPNASRSEQGTATQPVNMSKQDVVRPGPDAAATQDRSDDRSNAAAADTSKPSTNKSVHSSHKHDTQPGTVAPAPAPGTSTQVLGDSDDDASSTSSSSDSDRDSGSSSCDDDLSPRTDSTEPAATNRAEPDVSNTEPTSADRAPDVLSTEHAKARPAESQHANASPAEGVPCHPPGSTTPSSNTLAQLSGQPSAQSTYTAPLTLATVSEALKKKLGYTLHVAPSGIAHADAGQGLWLEGRAPVGAVVALYPGLVYSPMHYRRIPGFPKIDAHNDYFLARFDGQLLDGHAWTRVAAQIGSMQSTGQPESAVHKVLLAQLQQLETRHPLAQAHFANHPPAGTQANVMVAAYDFATSIGEQPWLNAYMPNVMYKEQQAQNIQNASQQPTPVDGVKGVAFVATRELQDEELLLNYRLNPQVRKPDWYTPLDVDEDKRRWY